MFNGKSLFGTTRLAGGFRMPKKIGGSVEPPILVRVFITDLQKDGRTYSFRAGFAGDTSEKRNLKGNRS